MFQIKNKTRGAHKRTRQKKKMTERFPLVPFLGSLGAFTSGALLAYIRLIRPWHLHWGATEHEVQRTLPGDNRIMNAKLAATHAITVDAPLSNVWQWIVQMGQGRGGFYTYDWLENLMFRLNMHSADRILSDFQNLQVGETFPLAPGGFGPPVMALVPGTYLLVGGKIDAKTGKGIELETPSEGNWFAVTWLFFLEPLGANQTRVLERFRADWSPGLLNTLYMRGFMEPGSFIFERGMLRGIKQRAEAWAMQTAKPTPMPDTKQPNTIGA